MAELYRTQLSEDAAEPHDEAIDTALEDIFPRGLPPRPQAPIPIHPRLAPGDAFWIVVAGIGWGGAVALGLAIALYVPEFGFAPLGFGVFLGLLVFGLLCFRAQRPTPVWPPATWRSAFYCPRDRVLYFADEKRPFPPGHLAALLE